MRACSNRSLTREAPTPTNISTNSEPLILKKGTLASPATALAKSVLPVPGGPKSNTPLGILAPRSVNFLGSFRNSTTSIKSSLASFIPATSLNVMRFSDGSIILARLFPKLSALAPPPCILLRMNNHAPMRIMNGNQLMRRFNHQEV